MSVTTLSRPVARARAEATKTSWLGWLATAMQAIETRRRLAQMDDRMLKDIGISRGEALEEAGRAPWDLSPTRPRTPWDVR
jgi:uncharacterized protein YjiS (DUF1127 family)